MIVYFGTQWSQEYHVTLFMYRLVQFPKLGIPIRIILRARGQQHVKNVLGKLSGSRNDLKWESFSQFMLPSFYYSSYAYCISHTHF